MHKYNAPRRRNPHPEPTRSNKIREKREEKLAMTRQHLLMAMGRKHEST